jgi:transcriptional regulator with XRE-family HTH domain
MYNTNTLGTDLPTGIEYTKKGATGFGSTAYDRIMQISHHKFLVGVTGEEVIPSSEVWPTFLEYLPLGHIASAITGIELHVAPVIYAFIYPNDSLNNTVTSSHITLFVNDWVPPKAPISVVYQEPNIATNSVSAQAEYIRAISGLRTERLAEIFTVTRTTYQNWLTGAITPHESHREHLLEVLPLVEEASQRLGSSSAVSSWLLTPVSSGGKKPIDYLKARQYSAFRGFLLQVSTGREILRSFIQPDRTRFERSKQDIEYGLERLRPTAWKENAEENELNTEL